MGCLLRMRMWLMPSCWLSSRRSEPRRLNSAERISMVRTRAGTSVCDCVLAFVAFLLIVFSPRTASNARGQATSGARDAGVPVGAQYDSTHVYVAAGDLDAFVKSVNAT